MLITILLSDDEVQKACVAYIEKSGYKVIGDASRLIVERGARGDNQPDKRKDDVRFEAKAELLPIQVKPEQLGLGEDHRDVHDR